MFKVGDIIIDVDDTKYIITAVKKVKLEEEYYKVLPYNNEKLKEIINPNKWFDCSNCKLDLVETRKRKLSCLK